MTKKVKNKTLHTRVDEALDARINAYTAAAEMDRGELIRRATDEYMANHPVKQPKMDDGTLAPSIKQLAGRE